ncbi:hypothetical protein DUNSADRAFT_2621 [Dunaliella salina]|uniref:Encoded protein n=1 Tax=Dunaliella salina TaxID=3046 RepID=A0ABQ7GVD5_DUNSA|nr:hypothetical protein DUNSADRAFT_2621 [Dunaliella salina]|eukprot:KAF5838562.1 hypothetical protein DUNSADRAFT_2621 [Dunaliella salina]
MNPKLALTLAHGFFETAIIPRLKSLHRTMSLRQWSMPSLRSPRVELLHRTTSLRQWIHACSTLPKGEALAQNHDPEAVDPSLQCVSRG